MQSHQAENPDLNNTQPVSPAPAEAKIAENNQMPSVSPASSLSRLRLFPSPAVAAQEPGSTQPSSQPGNNRGYNLGWPK